MRSIDGRHRRRQQRDRGRGGNEEWAAAMRARRGSNRRCGAGGRGLEGKGGRGGPAGGLM